ncbi:conserved hypothetical pox protein [Squirrelpox virus]|uniref:Conserved hypothetical pox protein n=1 Tax=Squirrelpox virus TaxID=240426 RepID=U3UBH3_9POXV|nr:conserved hypothetical pox protein [Squirrelpox virus]CCD83239.1 conserved hypothetical pox protein [Squirrelpox virus]
MIRVDDVASGDTVNGAPRRVFKKGPPGPPPRGPPPGNRNPPPRNARCVGNQCRLDGPPRGGQDGPRPDGNRDGGGRDGGFRDGGGRDGGGFRDGGNRDGGFRDGGGRDGGFRDGGARDFVADRLCDHDRATAAFARAPGDHIAVRVSEEEAGCWAELSSLVRARRATGFPMMRGAGPAAAGRVVYFEQFRATTVRRLALDEPCVSAAALFQVAAILYSLYRRGIYFDRLELYAVSIPRTTFSFSVSQLVFQFTTDVLVVLSHNVRLYRVELPQACYLDHLRCLAAAARRGFEASDYFFEWMLRNHLDFVSRQYVDVFKLKKKYAPGPRAHRHTEPGTVVFVPRDDAFLVGVTLTDVSISDNVRVMYSADGAVFEVDDFSVYDVFLGGEILVRTQSSLITL